MRSMRKVWLATTAATAALIPAALPAPASAATACVAGSTSSYVALGSGGCTVGPLTFYDFSVATLGNATLNSPNVTVSTSIPGEFGLSLNFSTIIPSENTDVNWGFDVSGASITDAYVSVTGGGSNGGLVSLSEGLQNSGGSTFETINLSGTGSISTTVIFSSEPTVIVSKDQTDFANGGTASSSVLTDDFSVATPIPGTLALFASGLVGLFGLRRKRKPQAIA